MCSGKLQEGHFPVVCVYKKSAFTLTPGSDALKTVGRVVLGQANATSPSPPRGPFLNVPLGHKFFVKRWLCIVVLNSCVWQL